MTLIEGFEVNGNEIQIGVKNNFKETTKSDENVIKENVSEKDKDRSLSWFKIDASSLTDLEHFIGRLLITKKLTLSPAEVLSFYILTNVFFFCFF